MNLAEFAIRQRVFVVFFTVLCVIAGIISYFDLGKLEDPTFTVKSAVVVVLYPGASASEVERQVTDKLEIKLQEMESLWKLRTLSRPGSAMIFLDLYDEYKTDRLPEQWDLLRRKVSDVKLELPPSAQISIVLDEFSTVYGMVFSVYGDGIEYAHLRDYAKELQRRIKSVAGIAKIEMHGERKRVVNIDLRVEDLARWKLSTAQVLTQLAGQNMMEPGGSFIAGSERIRVDMSGTFQTLDDIRDMTVRGGIGEIGKGIIRLGDVADITLDYQTPQLTESRYNGHPAVTLAVSPRTGINVVSLGGTLKKVIDDYQQELPLGVEIGIAAFQPDEVQKSISSFIINLLESIVIVVAILFIFMGWRSATIVGSTLILAILCTLIYMLLSDIALQRVSVGTFILALGMLVDNSIVITDMISTKLKKGIDRLEAASSSVKETGIPLLAATVIAFTGASPVFFSTTDSGEFSISVFQVLCSSLLLSWIIAMTITPLMCWKWLKVDVEQEKGQVEENKFMRRYGKAVHWTINSPKKAVMLVIPLLLVTLVAAMNLPVNFMPYSDRPLIFLDYWLPNGSKIEQTSADMQKIEQWLLKQPQVKDVTTFVGESAPRFSVTVEPEPLDPSYGQFLINVNDHTQIDELVQSGDIWLRDNFPNAEPRFRNLKLATKDKYSLEARFSGPDPEVLHQLSNQAKDILAAHPQTKYIRDDWRQQSTVLVPLLNQEEGRRSDLNRIDIAAAIQRSTDGFPVSFFRQNDRLIPIKIRSPHSNMGNLDSIPVRSLLGGHGAPLGQLVSEFKLEGEETMIWRRNRMPTISAQADVQQGVIATKVQGEIAPDIEKIALPTGYTMEWGGEYYEARRAVVDVFSQLPKTALISLVIMVALFNGFLQPAIILITLPLASIGIIAMMMITGQPFGFMALVGAISLSGMITKNGIVLLDQIGIFREKGLSIKEAVETATLDRTMSISMGALTTLLGMIPLLSDQLFGQMAACIIGGLAVATFLSLFIMPALYIIFNASKIQAEQAGAS
ncbi:efflux RND transporter permease subunit [methanotrophic endosymbiont of Bathymodiolus puteoserpentis (Logatchev)]|jgi:multidrug efflux pump subunit AcrB|uniref:efflux RND transporter permease subunit n=1 Tax=methanotrophic endosymbiont of Bathymodiolus puteoserpentis (Logatchev) TaxID=343235 RepID=UPI0013CBCF4D|nr:efflux RND transporter permease subunit [methanotrophic endosymbiont of Bathymodiolus puteoserpentis (Logatchev)]SHE23128.1 Acriflavin resistance protein [methanotrophic endosymbiont of Bathymodiolus puteoserpentis (Logatchev)]